MPTNQFNPIDNNHGSNSPAPATKTGRTEDSPGYETTDVNVGGIVVFLSGLFAFVLVFFAFCFGMGKVINSALNKSDGPSTKWNQSVPLGTAAQDTQAGKPTKREDLASNPEMEQREFQRVTASFPTPRLDIDDGNQATADMHAREDLLLNFYSTYSAPESQNRPTSDGSVVGTNTGKSATDGQVQNPASKTTIRIPIDRAMELIVERGLPQAPHTAAAAMLVGDSRASITAPLTTGFARTGYELDTIEAREQKMSYGKAMEGAHAELRPTK